MFVLHAARHHGGVTRVPSIDSRSLVECPLDGVPNGAVNLLRTLLIATGVHWLGVLALALLETSDRELQNLTMRMEGSRVAWLPNDHSRTLENHEAAPSLSVAL